MSIVMSYPQRDGSGDGSGSGDDDGGRDYGIGSGAGGSDGSSGSVHDIVPAAQDTAHISGKCYGS